MRMYREDAAADLMDMHSNSSTSSTAVLRSKSLSPLRGRALARPTGDTTSTATSDAHSSDAVAFLKDKPIRAQSPLSPPWGGVGIGKGGVHTRIHSHTGIANSSSGAGSVGVSSSAAADHRAGLGAHLRYACVCVHSTAVC
jgi:hypothetical protein